VRNLEYLNNLSGVVEIITRYKERVSAECSSVVLSCLIWKRGVYKCSVTLSSYALSYSRLVILWFKELGEETSSVVSFCWIVR
jgi:hypothetical protein